MKRKFFIFVSILVLCGLGALSAWFLDQFKHPVWTLTQYSDVGGSQAMCYSLKNNMDGTLIMIDGGWSGNAEQVKHIIDINGGKVDAWILTHYHEDHIGAFNALYPQLRKRISTIYATPLDWESFEETAREWDTPDSFSLFLHQTAGAGNIVYLNRDDEFDLYSFHVNVLNSFDDYVKEMTTDYANNCTLVLKLTGQKDTALFLGDLSDKRMGQFLLDRYGADVVHADIVQSAHHGNWGQTTEFYDQLSPKTLFFDAPEYIMTGEQYDARLLKAWCDEQGIQTFDYRTAPNAINIE